VEVVNMFHPAISAAMAHERHTTMIKEADRRRTLRAISRDTRATNRATANGRGR
jgi:hypothetical protein